MSPRHLGLSFGHGALQANRGIEVIASAVTVGVVRPAQQEVLVAEARMVRKVEAEARMVRKVEAEDMAP
jgi:hypothetical protein